MFKVISSLLIFGFLIVFFSFPHFGDKLINKSVMKAPYEVSEQAKSLHARLTIIDLHSDVLMNPRSLLEEASIGHVDVPRLIKGNVAIQAFTTVSQTNIASDLHNVPSDSFDIITLKYIAQFWPMKTWNSRTERTFYQADIFADSVTASNGSLKFIKNKEDLNQYLAARKSNQDITAGFLGIEGLHALDGDINNVDRFYHAGYRMMAPVHFFDNRMGGSAHGTEKMGLSDFGRDVIKRMNTLNILLDISHSSPKMIDDILSFYDRPILVSHTGVKGTCDNPRNLSDEHLKAIAAGGGVIGIAFFEMAICGQDLKALIDAINYTVGLVGVDFVGLGSDFDGMVTTVFDSSGFILLTDALLKEGYSEEDVYKIMGGNTLRVLKSNLPD